MLRNALIWLFKKEYTLFLFFLTGFLVFVKFAHAGVLPEDGMSKIEGLSQTVNPVGDTATDIIIYFLKESLIPKAKYIFVALAILFFTLDLFIMINSSGNEEEIGKHRKAMLWGLLGFAFISLSGEIASIFISSGADNEVMDAAKTTAVIQKFISYLQLSLSVIAMIFIFHTGFILITKADDEEEVSKAKKHLIWSFIGLVIAMISDPLVNKVFFTSQGAGSSGDAQIQSFAEEIAGILKFALSFLATLVFVAFLLSGFYFITSFGEEEKHTKAKEIVVWTIVGAILISISYALVAFFVGQN